METDDSKQYRVVRSRSRVYKSTGALKGLYTINAILLSFSLVLAIIPTLMLLLNSLDEPKGSILQLILQLGLAFFYPLTFFTLIALLLNMIFIFLLALGIQKDSPLLTGAISLLTAGNQIMILSLVITLPILIVFDEKMLTVFTVLFTFFTGLVSDNPTVIVLIFFLMALTSIHILTFLIISVRAVRENLTKTPLSTFFPTEILIESARMSDVESMMKLYASTQRDKKPGKNSHELWKELMKNVDLEKEVRIARADENIVGFLITSQEFTKVESVHLKNVAVVDEAERCLLRDFARLYSRSNQYVDFVKVSSSDTKLQSALSHNGWIRQDSESSSRVVGFRYVGPA